MPFIIGALISGGAGLLGAAISGSAAESAAQTQANAANQSAQIQQQEFNQTQQNLSPFIQPGNALMAQLLAGLGVNTGAAGGPTTPGVVTNPYGTGASPGGGIASGGATGTTGFNYGPLNAPFNPANLAQTPGYQFALQQGTQALTDQATATGGVGGGNTLKALLGYGQGLASTTYQQQLQDYMAQQNQAYNQLSAASGLSENAAAGLGNTGAQVASSIGSTLTGGAAAQAAGTVGVANAASGALGSLGSNYLLASLLSNSGAGAGSGLGAYSVLAGTSGGP
jgi:hypothetical protein